MPYIKPAQRDKYEEALALLNNKINDPGELNYVITSICHQILEAKGVRYLHVNAIVGALECVKFELYRRVISLYEDQKIAENGDVGIGGDLTREFNK